VWVRAMLIAKLRLRNTIQRIRNNRGRPLICSCPTRGSITGNPGRLESRRSEFTESAFEGDSKKAIRLCQEDFVCEL
jgi:hypothetical protein